MKFDSFVKYAGSDGSILTSPNNEKWLFFNAIGMKIPEYKNVCGASREMPEYICALLYEESCDPSELVDAFVPNADSKPSELMRTFASLDVSVDISNKAFGFIEKKDRTFTTKYEDADGVYKAVLVTDDYSDDDPEFKMIIIERED